MKGKHEVLVRNARVQYKFTVERNITILRGDSATGKTTLIEMIAAYQRAGAQSGVDLRSDKPCAVLTEQSWQLVLGQIHDSIVFIDEGGDFVRTKEFAKAVKGSDNYYVIATRAPLPELPYSIREIYGIKNTAGNRYQGTKRLYAEFYPLVDAADAEKAAPKRPDLVVVEDSNAGFAFFRDYFRRFGIRCISAKGKSNVFRRLIEEGFGTALLIADGAAFGAEITDVLRLRDVRSLVLYLPESFEWLILRSGAVNDPKLAQILSEPSENIESKEYFSWERFFTALLTELSRGTYLEYSKRKLNPNYLQKAIMDAITDLLPDSVSGQD